MIVSSSGFGLSNPAVARLQRGLALLSFETGDAALMAKVDGIAGPETVVAVNKAMTYITAAPANFRTGKLTIAQVKTLATQLSSWVEREVKARQAAKPSEPVAVTTPPGLLPAKPFPTALVIGLGVGTIALVGLAVALTSPGVGTRAAA
jgi:lysozyme family protein